MHKSPPDSDTILIGLDGGATKMSGWLIESDPETGLFQLGQTNIVKLYSDYDGFQASFVPVDLNIQISEMNSGIRLRRDEGLQGEILKQAAVDVITALISEQPGKKVLIGIGMPGLKTPDQRGIAVLANGPRIPDFCDHIEAELAKMNIQLRAPIARLGSDADYCGLGEEYSARGLFRDATNAYYLGGGTGVADALKLKGSLVPFDQAKPWIAKAWEMKTPGGLSFEHYTSASGIQKLYSSYSNIPLQELNKRGIFPKQILEMALNKDETAIRTMLDVAQHLALLLYERITTIFRGWSNQFAFINSARKITEIHHPYVGTLLDRIIIGQRLGDLLAQNPGSGFLRSEVENRLAGMLRNSDDPAITDHFLTGNRFKENIIRTSGLREAPALGAGIDAYLAFENQ